MAQVSINKVVNANVYVDGANLLGKVMETDAPDIKFKYADHKALGLVGSPEFISGIDKMESKIKWTSFYKDVITKFSSPFNMLQLQLRSSIEGYDSNGRNAQLPMQTFMTVASKNLPGGNFKMHDNVELETSLAVYAFKQIINGETLVEIDILANIFKVNGVDQLAQFRRNLGV